MTICAMIRDEQDYLDEWLTYHLDGNLGIERVHLLNNGVSGYCLTARRKSGGKVSIEQYRPDEHTTQTQADGFTRYAREHPDEWTFYIDVDEFLQYDPVTLRVYLAGREITYIQPVFYNANGQRERTAGKVQERFTQVSPWQDWAFRYIKCLVHNAEVDYFTSAHECVLRGERRMKVAPPLDVVHLRHYFTKSLEEWRGRYRGAGWVSEGQCSDEVFRRHNPDMGL